MGKTSSHTTPDDDGSAGDTSYRLGALGWLTHQVR